MQPFKDLPPLPNPFAPRAEEATPPKAVQDAFDYCSMYHPDPAPKFEINLLPPFHRLEDFRYLGPKCLPAPKLETHDDVLRAYIGELEKACAEKDKQIVAQVDLIDYLKAELAAVKLRSTPFPWPPLTGCFGSGSHDSLLDIFYSPNKANY